MIRPALFALAVLLALVVVGCDGGDEEQPPPPATTAPREARPPVVSPGRRPPPLDFARVETVAEGLEVPWELAFPSKGAILVTERPGRVRLVEGGRVHPEPVLELDVRAEDEAGLLGLALHPDFPKRRVGYLYYTTTEENRVSRFRVGQDFRFEDERILIDGIPASSFHDGGRIAFGPDGMLYVTTGESGDPGLADDLDSLGGKILRIGTDGEVPADNPFGDSPIFSYGHRNPQGLDWDRRGRLYASEHGPTGHDEVNLIEPGEFYGWPFKAGRATNIAGEPPQQPVDPIAESGGESTWAPAGLVVHEARGEPTTLLLANLAGEGVRRLVLRDGDPRSVARADLPLSGFGRVRALTLGPDDCLYATTSNTDGRGDPRAGDDRIIRVCPQS